VSAAPIASIVQAAVADGTLPPDAAHDAEHRPWPVVLLIGLGAWLATLPLLVAFGLLFGDAILRGPFAVIAGLLLVGAAVFIFRTPTIPLFVEQLGLPAMLVGGGLLAFGMFHNGPPQLACGMLGLIALGVAIAAARSWVRNLLGVIAAVLITLAFVTDRAMNLDRGTLPQFWVAWHISFGLWLLSRAMQAQLARRGTAFGLIAAIESIAAGWLAAVLIGLAWLAGMTFLAGAVIERDIANDIAREMARQHARGGTWLLQPAVSALLAGSAAWVGANAWPSLRQAWCIGLAAVLVGLSWFMPSLGAVTLALVLCVTSQRWLQAGLAGLAFAWIVGAFYYALAMPLAQKALILLVAGVVLAALAWFGASMAAGSSAGQGVRAGGSAASRRNGLALGGIAASVLLTLVAANAAIWQKEQVIRNGRAVYVELAPVDPRSLMQGDFMALDFRLPREGFFDTQRTWQRPVAIGTVDPRGVATLRRIDGSDARSTPEELRIELTQKGGRWTVVTDAWFFREGDGERFGKARYGEFRVLPDGKALLVGMADAELRPIR